MSDKNVLEMVHCPLACKWLELEGVSLHCTPDWRLTLAWLMATVQYN